MTRHRRGDWMQTFTGRKFWPCDPRADEVCIEDIAHALSMQCRFAGHVREFYSVAEHCVRVSHVVPMGFALAALLHDAAEAYVVDLPRPIKRQPELWSYRAIEDLCHAAIQSAFAVPFRFDAPAIIHADEVMLATEARDLMGGQSAGKWRLSAEPLDEPIRPWTHDQSRRRFLDRFREVYAG